MDTSISRRAALVGGISGAGVLVLAACSSGSGGGGTTSGAAPANPPATNPSADGAATGAATGQATDHRSSNGLAALDSIPVGQAVAATLNGKPVLVARPTSTTAACFSAICTHQGCTVRPAGKQLECPCHGSVYDATTGAVVSGPAPRALDKIAVSVDGGDVVPSG